MSDMHIPTWVSNASSLIEAAWLKSESWIVGSFQSANLWSGFWPAVFGAGGGALIASWLERRRREEDRIRYELGQCHTLVFMLTHILETLEDFNDQLFENPAKTLGHKPDWDEVGGLEGAPEHGPDFSISDYTFLIDGSDHKSDAPAVLKHVYTLTTNFNAILARLSQRTILWHDYLEYRSAGTFARGLEALQRMSPAIVLVKRLEELTVWLAEDIPEEIEKARALLPQLYGVMSERYPKQQFIVPQPIKSETNPID